MASGPLLEAPNPLVGDDIGIAYFQSGRFEGTVEVDNQLVGRTLFGHPLIVVDHPLVAVVHEIDFESLDPHVGIMLDQLHVLLYGEPGEPEDDPHPLLPSVLHEFAHINALAHGIRVAHILAPPLVEQYVLHAVA